MRNDKWDTMENLMFNYREFFFSVNFFFCKKKKKFPLFTGRQVGHHPPATKGALSLLPNGGRGEALGRGGGGGGGARLHH